MNYTDLQNKIADWLNRQDLADVIPTFIELFEAQFNADPRARIAALMEVEKATINDEWVPLPGEYVEVRNLHLHDAPRPRQLQYITPNQFDYYGYMDGRPRFYTIIGEYFRLLPPPNDLMTLEMSYFRRLPALSASNPQNRVLRQHPNIYLYGSLIQAEPYLKNDERLPTWSTMYNASMEAMQVTDQRALHSGSPLKIRTRGFG